jgi:hypothetical protein
MPPFDDFAARESEEDGVKNAGEAFWRAKK